MRHLIEFLVDDPQEVVGYDIAYSLVTSEGNRYNAELDCNRDVIKGQITIEDF